MKSNQFFKNETYPGGDGNVEPLVGHDQREEHEPTGNQQHRLVQHVVAAEGVRQLEVLVVLGDHVALGDAIHRTAGGVQIGLVRVAGGLLHSERERRLEVTKEKKHDKHQHKRMHTREQE